MLDKSEVTTLSLPSTASHGGSDSNISAEGAAGSVSGGVAAGGGGEGTAGGAGCGEPQRTRAALEHLQQKILKVTEQIRVEQEARDDNVAEYLKLAHNADKQQASRIKQVFEKKNQKSAQTIAHLHKKLEHYHKKLKEIEQNGPARQPKDSGSAPGSNSGGAGGGGGGMLGPTMGSPRLDGHHHHHHHVHSSWDSLLEGLQEIKASQAHMEDTIEDMKGQLQSDYSYMTQCLQEERYRYERLEEQLSDLTELHQNEMSNLKQELASMEEKVAYQSYERARDIQEAVESCLTRITKLELQQQQQQVVQLEGVENANARALLGKLINVILALMAVLLVFVSTLANFITPLMKTRARVGATVLLTVLLFVLWKHWDFVDPWLIPS
ncbi:transmembrane and coiled-coil domains protein 2 [Hippocampus comes]|uniref:transmembrane and coiled-coil domains protein 2 n=1 Tax=Hippocampus comes TaxID=109280 RepID=UPI00094E069A|nr:PREDICTED: transmembrane and coiled-coil domains protein 2-like [Hippocampus comes]